MAEKFLQLDEIWPMVLHLSSLDKMRLVERVATWFAHELTTPEPTEPSPIGWGAQLVKDIESGVLDTNAWVAMPIVIGVVAFIEYKGHLDAEADGTSKGERGIELVIAQQGALDGVGSHARIVATPMGQAP